MNVLETRDKVSWFDAMERSNDNSGWRVPTIFELAALRASGSISSLLCDVGWYWSSSVADFKCSHAWMLSFSDNHAYAARKDEDAWLVLVEGDGDCEPRAVSHTNIRDYQLRRKLPKWHHGTQ